MPAQTSFTDAELTTPFAHSILPNSVASTDRNSDGLLQNTALLDHIASLKKSGVIPNTDVSADVYHAKMTVFVRKAQNEYHYYDSRYKYSLEQLFSAIRSGYNSPSDAVNRTIQIWLGYTTTFNTKLNDLIQIIQSITNDIFTSSKTMDSATTTMASTMLSNKQKLQRQNAILRSNQASKKIYKEMVSYNDLKQG